MIDRKGKMTEPEISEFLDYLDFAVRLKRSYVIIEKLTNNFSRMNVKIEN